MFSLAQRTAKRAETWEANNYTGQPRSQSNPRKKQQAAAMQPLLLFGFAVQHVFDQRPKHAFGKQFMNLRFKFLQDFGDDIINRCGIHRAFSRFFWPFRDLVSLFESPNVLVDFDRSNAWLLSRRLFGRRRFCNFRSGLLGFRALALSGVRSFRLGKAGSGEFIRRRICVWRLKFRSLHGP